MAKIIMSAYRAHLSMGENMFRMESMMNRIKETGLAFGSIKQGLGYFKEEGQEEASREVSVSFIPTVTVTLQEAIKEAMALAADYEQDAILVVMSSGRAWLYCKDGSKVLLGFWSKVTKEQAYKNGAFSYINAEYWCAM